MERVPAETELILAGYMALSGSVALIRLDYARLAKRLPEELLQETQERYRRLAGSICELPKQLSDWAAGSEPACLPPGEDGKSFCPPSGGELQSACLPLGDGGVFNGLWRMAREWRTGFVVEIKELPVRQETIEICEALAVNPYYLHSENSFLIAAANGGRLCRLLREQGWPAAVIGTLTGKKEKNLRRGSTLSCLNRPQEDEWERYRREKEDEGERSRRTREAAGP